MKLILKKRRKLERKVGVIDSIRGKKLKVPFKVVISFLLFILVIFCLYFLYQSELFLIEEIIFHRQEVGNEDRMISEQDLLEEMANWQDYSIFTFPEKEEEARFLEKFISLSEFNIRKKLPDKLDVYFKERKQMALVKARNGIFILDEGGLVFWQGEEEKNIPVFEYEEELQLGQVLSSDNLNFALEVVSLFEENDLIADKFSFLENDVLEVVTDGGIKCIFVSSKNIDLQFVTLQFVLRDATIKGREFERIDLRFSRPVLVEK